MTSQPRWAEINTTLRHRLDELMAVTPLLPGLPVGEIRLHAAGVRRFLLDDVLRHAHDEELLLFPALDELGAGGAWVTGVLLAEHDTVRDAAGSLDEVAARPMTTTNVEALTGVLKGIGLLLDGHLAHESEAAAQLLAPSA